jgi:hypothetical protein
MTCVNFDIVRLNEIPSLFCLAWALLFCLCTLPKHMFRMQAPYLNPWEEIFLYCISMSPSRSWVWTLDYVSKASSVQHDLRLSGPLSEAAAAPGLFFLAYCYGHGTIEIYQRKGLNKILSFALCTNIQLEKHRGDRYKCSTYKVVLQGTTPMLHCTVEKTVE